jgi:energy-coupling factor transporter transmembrane protein EcfT
MTARYDLFAPGDSWLHRLDPRVKLILSALAALLVLLWSSLSLLLTALVVSHVLLALARYPRELIAGVWRALAPLLTLIVLLWPVFDRRGEILVLVLGPLALTGEAFLRGLATASRIAALSFTLLLWLGTTDQRALVRSLVQLGVPFSLGMAMTIGLRFIPTVASMFQTVSEAFQARGLDLPPRGLRRLRAMPPILIAALVTALRMSEQLGWTLAARGVGAPVRRTTLRDLAMQPVDWLILAAGLATGLSLLWLTVVEGLGRTLR